MARSKKSDEDRDEVLAEISGASVQINPWGGYVWNTWGSGRMMLTPTRVIERTKFLITERRITVLLNQVNSVSIITQPNPVLLALGFILLIVLIGLIFLLLALFFRHNYLVIKTASDVLVIGCKGNMSAYEDFVQDILDEIDRARAASQSAPAPSYAPAPSHAPAASEPAPARVSTGPAAQKAVRCGECGAEYRIPAGSGGKRFKCQKCQAVITVGDDY